MKRITEERAVQLLNQGICPKCKINSHKTLPITSIEELNRLKRLGELKVQGFELFENNVTFKIPEGAMEVNVDDAADLLANFELIHCKRESTKETEEITTTNELMCILQSCKVRGDKFVLYWYA